MADLNELLDGGPEGAGTSPPLDYPDLSAFLGYSPSGPFQGSPSVAQAQDSSTQASGSDPVTSPEATTEDGASNLTTGAVTSPEQSPGLSSYIGGPAQPLSQVGFGSPGPGQTQTLKAGQGAGVSVSGYNPAANAAIQRGPHAALTQDIAAGKSAVQAEFAPGIAESRRAADEARLAQLQESQAESDKILATSRAKQDIAKANTDFLTREQAAVDQARAESAANMANYKAALADFSAQKVNGAQLWDNAGAGGQFAMMAAAFAHDFLGVKGMQTSGLDTVRQAIKQNIDVQLENIRHKREVASGFKEIWEMQRAQSATDAEARTRMYGFSLEALKNQLDSEMGKYDAKLATTKGAAAIAKLNQEQAKNDLLLQQHIDTSAHQVAQEKIDVYKSDLAASTAKYTANAHIEAAKIAAGAKDKSSPLEGLLADRNGVAYRRFLPDVEKSTRDKYREQTQKVGDTAANIDHLIMLQDQIGKTPPDIGVEALKKMQSEAARTAELVRNTTKMGIIYDNSGKQINEQEVKLYNEIVGQKDWWLNGDNVRTLGMLAKQTLDKNDAIIRGLSYELPQTDPARGFNMGGRQFDPAGSALNDIYSQPGGGKHQEDAVDEQIKGATAPKAGKETVTQDEAPPHAGAAWAGYVNSQHPGAGSVANSTGLPATDIIANEAARGQIHDVPKDFISIDNLAQLVLQGNQKAAAELESLAKGDGNLALYAQYEKALLNAR